MDGSSRSMMDKFFSFAESVSIQTVGLTCNTFASLMLQIENRTEFRDGQATYLAAPDTGYRLVKDRLARLLVINEDKQTRDMYDTTFVIYLLLVYRTDAAKAKQLIKEIRTSRLHNLWWTRFAIDFISKGGSDTGSAIDTFDLRASSSNSIATSQNGIDASSDNHNPSRTNL